MTDEELKALFQQAMDYEAERIMDIVNADPALKDVQAPPEIREKLFAQIAEYEEQKRLAQLSEEDREYIRLGKVYKKRRKWNRVAVLIAALVAILALGTVSMGEDKNILNLLKQMLSGGEQTVSDSGSTEPTRYIEEEELYEKIENEYGFTPVKLDYLPSKTTFIEGVFGSEIQNISMAYKTDDGASILYVIRPNYRESSFGSIVEDEKVQEYTIHINDIPIAMTEYRIVESGRNRWSIDFVYQDVQYLLRITNMTQEEVEKIVDNLGFQIELVK